MDALLENNNKIRKYISHYITNHRKIVTSINSAIPNDYSLYYIKEKISYELNKVSDNDKCVPVIELIERNRYNCDLVLKFPDLLSEGGPKLFIDKHINWIKNVLLGSAFSRIFSTVNINGMYINITLTDQWILDSAINIINIEGGIYLNDSLIGETYIVDYSSPNVAKKLHAGHIRSTIIGHVLSNIYESCGALVYRINHINDFGGFGFILEGYRRFKNIFPEDLTKNEILLELYRIRRTAERIVSNNIDFNQLDSSEKKLMIKYFKVRNTNQLTSIYNEYVLASDKRFSSLESGCKEEIDLWKKMVNWSISDFDKFYKALNINFDLIIGESFYINEANSLIEKGIHDGTCLHYTKELSEHDIKELKIALDKGAITDSEYDDISQSIVKNIGAIVLPLDNNEQYVIKKSNGHSIYSTRDLGAIKVRNDLFNPSKIIYIVGQEQKVHFERLFRSAYKLKIATQDKLKLKHLYFGFYIDSRTKQKLSSRDSVSNVNVLLSESIKYFRNRLSKRIDINEQELYKSSRELAIGSIIFNDLKNDIKGSVEIDTIDMEANIKTFEQSGGAYIVYSICRARSILTKCNNKISLSNKIVDFTINNQEVYLILMILQIIEKVKISANKSNPSILVRHLLSLASIYNSYYTNSPVIINGIPNKYRLIITKAVEQSLTYGLKICHIDSPNSI